MAEPDDGPDDDGPVDYELDPDHVDVDVGADDASAGSWPPIGILLGGGAVLGLLALVLALFGAPGDWAGRTPSAPSASPSASPAGSPSGSPSGVDPGRLAVTDVNGVREFLPGSKAGLTVVALCGPQFDGAARLRVGLQVVNTSRSTIRLLDVRPRLRPGLLRLTGVGSGGSCGAPGDGGVALDLAASARVLVTMELRVLDTCPRTAPVGVRVRAQFADGPRTVSFPLFADLGSVVYSGC